MQPKLMSHSLRFSCLSLPRVRVTVTSPYSDFLHFLKLFGKTVLVGVKW